ncbi:hypothetical protein BO86DRAFT_408554 [Aspergillus japonicus CBS 114.51]|uniref:Retrovirus-related Pol polyprotein from transposon TNT 1-94-like beta-barrel domain-containing protein n=1 Tax=Aspergillus japonicus CBS 114.51 TaxID=1448312 RepID=A0A8T8X7J4_ASPJA|nr:hypothetical protein BO86DRAFT_408554 [Aspergillus japonicus CBS 114.51]RAH83602.1 hypothetical protein BO86DRAFT_408554 [Aspergillus japonicus CBS 114.51]
MVATPAPQSQPPPTTPHKIQKPKPKPTRRARTHQQQASTARCWDWLLLPAGSNTHFAKNRASFATYRRAPCRIANQRVLGVGTVQLRVRRAPDDARTTTLVLRDVLHMPQARWNGISVAKFTGDFCEDDSGNGNGNGNGGWRRGSAAGSASGRGSVGGQSESEEGEWVGGTESPLPVVVGVEGEGEAEHLQVRRASTTSTISSCGGGGGDEDRGEGLWFAEGRPERGCSRVVLAGEHHHPMPDVGELVDERMLKGLVVSKEELELLNERVRNRSWV